MQQFFGMMISACYKVVENDHKEKHFVVYKRAEKHGDPILQHAFQLSLVFTSKQPTLYDFEEGVLRQSLQVFLFQ